MIQAMVVEQEPEQRAYVASLLRARGCSVLEVAEHERAKGEILGGRPLDLMVVRWGSGAGGGYELVRVLRADLGRFDVRVLMTSGRTSLVSVAKALAAGVDELLIEPFTEEAFADKLALLGFR